MSCHQATTNPSNSTPIFDEHNWVIQIRQTLDEELNEEEVEVIPVSIFSVPKTLISVNPEAFIPQQVSLGPYHHLRQELYEMERYKLYSAKRTQKQLQGLKFKDVVDHFIKQELKIRAYYHGCINFNNETLAWIMAIDTSFLLEFLHVYALKDSRSNTSVSSTMSHLIDYYGRKFTHNAILRDIVMLENQIPLFLLRKMLGFQYPSSQFVNDTLFLILMRFCKELSPFKLIEQASFSDIEDRTHFLDLLYYMIIPKPKASCDAADTTETVVIAIDYVSDDKSSYVKEFIVSIWELLSNLKGGPVHYVKRAIVSKPVKLVAKISWKFISKLPWFSILKGRVEYLSKEDHRREDENANHSINNSPLIEEITIPSVTKLFNAGVRFCASNGDLSSVKFDSKTVTFYLPIVSLDLNTEVVLRNLVAYEASSASGPLVLTRYTELMNGIIDTENDVRLLREVGIVLNRMKSDGEVAALWNNMSKSVILTKVPFLDKVIEDVNRYYSGLWRVKAKKYVKRTMFGCWPVLTLLAAVVLLLLTALQAFCSVYNCSRYFNGVE